MSNRKDVYTIVRKEGRKPYWLNIGAAFVNKDQSLTVRLNALPINGELNIREPKAKDAPQAQ